MMFQKVQPTTEGKSFKAYKRQPQNKKWVCVPCGRTLVSEKNRKKGEPRFTQVSFDSRSELEDHNIGRHG